MPADTPKVTWQKDKADAALAPYREAKALAAKHENIGQDIRGKQHFHPRMSDDELAAIYLHVKRVPGMCPDDKIFALHDVMRGCPPGDVVEIGTWWGKSALVLLLLARRYGIGNVLCVDPWKDEELVQDVPHVDEASAALSAEEAFEVFKMSLLPYKQIRRAMHSDDVREDRDFNYLRMTSEDAIVAYTYLFGSKEAPRYDSIGSREFGNTFYSVRIALLHIDGNHAYEKVRLDLELWAPLVLPGGWVVVDDYDWRHGDGPRRAADEMIENLTDFSEMPEAPQHFVAGGAMFVQFNAKG